MVVDATFEGVDRGAAVAAAVLFLCHSLLILVDKTWIPTSAIPQRVILEYADTIVSCLDWTFWTTLLLIVTIYNSLH